MVRRTRTIWFLIPPLLALFLALWVGIFVGLSGADTVSFRGRRRQPEQRDQSLSELNGPQTTDKRHERPETRILPVPR
jgi:hypothetical protein